VAEASKDWWYSGDLKDAEQFQCIREYRLKAQLTLNNTAPLQIWEVLCTVRLGKPMEATSPYTHTIVLVISPIDADVRSMTYVRSPQDELPKHEAEATTTIRNISSLFTLRSLILCHRQPRSHEN
jgi:hypothetical protein